MNNNVIREHDEGYLFCLGISVKLAVWVELHSAVYLVLISGLIGVYPELTCSKSFVPVLRPCGDGFYGFLSFHSLFLQ